MYRIRFHGPGGQGVKTTSRAGVDAYWHSAG